MFAQELTALLSPQAEAENVPVPHVYDGIADTCSSAALRAMRTKFPALLPSDRLSDHAAYLASQASLRESLESLLWVSANRSVVDRLADLLGLLCAEYSWSAVSAIADDPTHPPIDRQAAETGVLIAWILRRHGARLDEADPNISYVAREQIRRRLFAPVVNHEDYPFMTGEGETPALILCDLLVTALLTERNRQKRSQPVKKLLRQLDRCEKHLPDGRMPIAQRLIDACALADTARVIKRMTRGDCDLTARVPDPARLDDVLSPYLGANAFLDPCGAGIETGLRGIDLFRLGYFTGDAALRALGAALMSSEGRVSRSVTGRVLSMEYLRAAYDEKKEPPRLQRAVMSDGTMMLTRSCGFTLAASSMGNRQNAGDVTLFFGNLPILADPGGSIHSLPVIGGLEPLEAPQPYPCEDDFNDARDLISMDLTDSYPPECGLRAYQRTLMLSRKQINIRLVDAFEFVRAPERVLFRFTFAERCSLMGNSIRSGPVTMTWDGEPEPLISEPENGYLVTLLYRRPPERAIFGFSFDLCDEPADQ